MSENENHNVTLEYYAGGRRGVLKITGSPDDVAATGRRMFGLDDGLQQDHRPELLPINGVDRTPLANGANETEYRRPVQTSTPKVEAPLPDPTVRSSRRRRLTYGKSGTDPSPDETINFYQEWDSDKNRDRTFTALEICNELGYSNPQHVKLLSNNLVRLGARRMFNLDGTRCRRRGCDVLTCKKD